MTSYAVVIPVDGQARSIEWPEDDGAQLRTMYDAIGCSTVELVPMPDNAAHMWVDEDGRLTGSPFNPVATALSGRAIVGTVILTPWSDGPDSPGYDQSQAFNLAYSIKRSQNV